MKLTGERFSNHKLRLTGHDMAFVLGRSGWILPAGMIVFFILIPFLTAGVPGNSIFNIEVTHDQLKFRLVHEDAILPVIGAAIVMGLLTGISMFRFAHDKNETTIFLSMGISRTRLFLDRLTAAVLMLAAMTALPVAVSAVLNISALGDYQALVRNAVFIWTGILLTSMVSCFIAAIACFFSGSLLEAGAYWAAVMAAPTVLCISINMLMKKLYWGNAWGVATYSGTEQIKGSLLDLFSFLNPVLFFRDEMEKSAQFMRPLSTDVPEDVSWGMAVAWLIVSAALAAVAWLVFIKWKAENAGITGSGKILAEITSGITGFMLFAAVFSYLFDGSAVLAAVAGAMAFIAIRLIWRKTGILDRESPEERVICVAVQAAAAAAVCIVLATGFFNGTERFLDGGPVNTAKVSYVGDPSLFCGEASGSSTGQGYYVMGEVSLKEKASIDRVKELHMIFEESGRQKMESSDRREDVVVPYDIVFSYTEDDGTEHTWYYDRASYGQLKELLTAEELPEVKEAQTRLFAGAGDGQEQFFAWQAYELGTVFITDRYMADTYQLTLGDDKRAQLLEAIGRDVEDMAPEDRYFPDESAEAVLMFSQSGEDDSSTFAYHLNNAFVYVTSEYENTIRWLRENDLMDYVTAEKEIESVTLQRMDQYIGMNTPDYPLGMYFMSYIADSADGFIVQKDFGNRHVITDSDEIEQIAAGLRNGYYMSDGGFLAAVKLAGEDGYRYMFLPESAVPEFIRG